MTAEDLLESLKQRPALLEKLELEGAASGRDNRSAKKLKEVAGFCDVILRYVRQWYPQRESLQVVEFSCGKSYLGLVLAVLLQELEGKRVRLTGVDINEDLVQKCARLAGAVGVERSRFVASRTIEFESDEEFDLALALHACDTATDEAIARGIQLGAEFVLTVPCCQNQIRGQIRSGHPLRPITDFGVMRYRLANMLTDALRAQFLHAAGYEVELTEIGSPRLTPKNLCICARKVQNPRARRRDADYRALRELFDVRPAVEKLCPGVIRDEEDR